MELHRVSHLHHQPLCQQVPLQRPITFRANHSFTDSYGDTGTWSIKNRMITLVYDNGLIRNVQFLIQDGYTSQTMVLTTTLNMAHGDTCLCSVVLRNVKR